MDGINCTRCSMPMQDLGEYNFRTGGATGLGAMFLGQWNELSERTVTLDMKVCPTCRHVEFFLRHV